MADNGGKRIRVGLVGLGGMMNVHYEQLRKVPGMTVTAVCDMDPAKTAMWGERLGLGEERRFSDAEALIADGEVDAIVTATPNDMHYAVAAACLRAGKPVMTEKPFTRTYEEAAALRELAGTTGADCFVGFSYRYVPSFRMAREWIRDGRLGAIRHVFVQYLQDWGVPMQGTPMNWRWDRPVTGTGVLHDLGAHMIDAVRFLVGEPASAGGVLRNLIAERPLADGSGTATVDIDDFAAFTLLLENGVPAVCQTSRNAYGSGNQIELAIYGDLGTLHIGYEFGETLVWMHRDEETGAKSREELRVPERYKLAQMADFADFARGGADEAKPTLIDGYRNQLALEAVVRSSETGRFVALEDVEAERAETRTERAGRAAAAPEATL